jgi:hypothetical protein
LGWVATMHVTYDAGYVTCEITIGDNTCTSCVVDDDRHRRYYV